MFLALTAISNAFLVRCLLPTSAVSCGHAFQLSVCAAIGGRLCHLLASPPVTAGWHHLLLARACHGMAAHPLRPQPPESAPPISVAGTAAGVTDELLGLHAEIKRFVEAVSPTQPKCMSRRRPCTPSSMLAARPCRLTTLAWRWGGKNAARTTATMFSIISISRSPPYISYMRVYQTALVQVVACSKACTLLPDIASHSSQS